MVFHQRLAEPLVAQDDVADFLERPDPLVSILKRLTNGKAGVTALHDDSIAPQRVDAPQIGGQPLSWEQAAGRRLELMIDSMVLIGQNGKLEDR